MKTLSDLKKGELAIIKNFTDDLMSLKILEMGCLPGSTVELLHTAPLGDPICIKVAEYMLALRKAEADTIIIENQ